MEATVIEEIAHQMGMAVDTAAQFVADILPQYAALMAWERGVVCAVLAVLLVLCIIATVKYTKWAKKEWNEYCTDEEFIILFFVGAALTLAVLVIALACNISTMGSWYFFPEAKLLDLVITRIGG